ncbi:hypothetical protein [Desulfolucanica intricata]|uniref:hypothetical protein n=1 Tax=Desulfolucanica intricata TaxID=1285191 RepID=UPI0008332E8F|nr:hypothetical protein [Desulfolucanica intricata]
MKISKRIKLITAISILAVGIPTAGFALTAPCEYTNTQLPVAAPQQISQPPVNTTNLDRQQTQTTAATPKVKPAAANNISAPVCNYNNYCNNTQCLQTSAPAAQVKAPSGSTVCPNYYNNNCRNSDSDGPKTGNYGHGAGHGRGGR